jgi:hypothetical protein
MDWLLNLPIPWMAVVIVAASFVVAEIIYLVFTRLAVGDRARAFKAISPGMLPPRCSSPSSSPVMRGLGCRT